MSSSLSMGLSVISSNLGMAYFICSVITNYRWMRIFSSGWWFGAILILHLPVNVTATIFTLMIFSFEFVPGICLFYNSKKKKTKLIAEK